MKQFHKNIISFYDPIEMPGGYNFDHVRTLKRIDLYYNSQFESGNTDSEGHRKFFYNSTKPSCDIATKFVDLDTKDIVLVSTKPDTEMKTWLMMRDLKQWLKEQNFGVLLNEIGFNYPKYGTVVVKKSKDGKIDKVNIQNLRMDPTADYLRHSSFVYELNEMTRGQIEDMKWDTSKLPENQESFLVYETYHKKGKGWDRQFLADPFKKKKGRGYARSSEAEINDETDYLPPIVLKKDKVDELPYRELFWEKVPGRWLGFGFAEYLFENQIADNEAENLERKGLYFKALQLFQTKDERIGRNVLTDLDIGQILRVNSEITPVNKDNSDLAAFNTTRARWNTNTERKTFSFDISRGGDLPSRTPLGVAQLSAGMVASYFELKRENFGLFLKQLLIKDIIPSFGNKSKKKHILTFVGSDPELEKLDRAIAEIKVNQAAIKFAKERNFMPSILEMDAIRTRIQRELKDRANRYLEVPDGFYENAEYIIDIIITGEGFEAIDPQNFQIAMQILMGNPGILENKVLRTILFRFLEGGKLSPVELNMLSREVEVAPQPIPPQAGSVARASAPAAAQPTEQQMIL